MSIFVQTDTPFDIPCRECSGDGWEVVRNHWGPPERDYCSHCGGPGLDFIDLACLSMNLAVAGALTAAYERGKEYGYVGGWQDARDLISRRSG